MKYAQIDGKVNIEFAYNSRNSINRLTFLPLCVIIISDMRQRHIYFLKYCMQMFIKAQKH